MNEQSVADELIRLDAYAPTRLVKNDVKNSSGFLQRFFPFCFAIGLHGLFLWWLFDELRATKTLPEEIITVLDFIQPEPRLIPFEVMPDMHVGKSSNEKRHDIKIATTLPIQTIASTHPVKKNTVMQLSIYDDTGRVRVPVDFIEKFDETNLATKRFDFQNPDLELAGTWLKRPPPAIAFNPTQFDQAWKPDQSILGELLDKAVEKTTKEIKIPVPGNPTVKLVCKVSVLALGGGCGFVPNGGYGRVIPDNEDDPDTLSPEEDRQCQAWWEKISNTKSQSE
ncbi:MAG: hypothetical protein ABI644_15050, partial [Arenimonas sp.]